MRSRSCALTIIGLVAFAAGPLRSQGTSTEAQARAALDRMIAAYKRVDALHVKVVWIARYTGAATVDDFPLPGPGTLELRMQRPNRLFMDAGISQDGKRWQYKIVSDGTQLWFWRTAKNMYWETNAPATFAEFPKRLPDDAIGTMTDADWNADSIMEWDLLTAERFPLKEEIGAAGVSLTFSGPEQLRGANVPQVHMKAAAGVPFTLDSRIYLDVETALVRGLAMSVHGRHPENRRDFSVEMQAAYEVFDVRPRFTTSDFTFVPPPGAKRAGG